MSGVGIKLMCFSNRVACSEGASRRLSHFSPATLELITAIHTTTAGPRACASPPLLFLHSTPKDWDQALGTRRFWIENYGNGG